MCCSCTAGSDTLPGRRGEIFAAVSGELLLYLKPPRSERNPFFLLTACPSCGLVASSWQDRRLLQRARLHTKTQKETQFAERHSSSLCFSGTARAPAAKLLLIVLSVIPPKTVKVSAESFLFSISFFRRMGALVPLQSPFLPNLLRPNLLRPKEASRQADISCPVHRETPIQGYCSRAFGGCIVGVFP